MTLTLINTSSVFLETLFPGFCCLKWNQKLTTHPKSHAMHISQKKISFRAHKVEIFIPSKNIWIGEQIEYPNQCVLLFGVLESMTSYLGSLISTNKGSIGYSNIIEHKWCWPVAFYIPINCITLDSNTH